MITRGMNPRRRRDASRESILMLEQKIMLLEMESELSENDRQSALRMSKMINDITADFKAYHFSIVDQITDEEQASAEQEILTEHELKVMNLIDRIAKIIGVPDGSVEKKEDKEKIILRKRLDRVERSYRTVKTEVDNDGPVVDVYTLQGRAGGSKLYKVRPSYRNPTITQPQDHLCACTTYNHIRNRKYHI